MVGFMSVVIFLRNWLTVMGVLVTDYCYDVVSYKPSHALRIFYDVLRVTV
jgi:hypothetical protein